MNCTLHKTESSTLAARDTNYNRPEKPHSPIFFVVMLFVSLLGTHPVLAAVEPTICMIPYSSDSKRAQITVKLAEKNAKSQGAKLVVYNEKFNSLEDQFSTFNKILQESCDAIVIEPHRHSEIAPQFADSINKAIKQGTPVVGVEAIEGAEFSSHLALDPRSVGDHLSRSTCKRVKSGDRVFHVFPHYRRKQDEDLEKSALKEFNFQVQYQCPGIEFISIEAAHPADVQPAVIEKFREYGAPALIVTDHPQALEGAMSAVEQFYPKDSNTDIKLIGFGATTELFRALEQKKVDALVVSDFHQFSERVITAAVLAASDQKLNLGKMNFVLHELTLKNADKYREWFTE